MKLELKHLAGYLPYGLKLKNTHGWATMETLNNWSVNGDYEESYCYETEDTTDFKPILHPLSDLAKEIKDGLTYNDLLRIDFDKNGVNGFDFYYLQECPLEYPFEIIQKLLEWHFDIHGLIEAGLAIDINELQE